MSCRWIGTSWKMNLTLAEAEAYAQVLQRVLRSRPELTAGIQPFIIPPATALAAVHRVFGDRSQRPGGLKLGVQNAHWEDSGAWTGEISVPQALDAGADIVEIGHSERREFFNETIRTTRLKVLAALRHGAYPLLCVGEPQEVRERGQAAPYILGQANGALEGLSPEELSTVLIAYEPIWAIGASGRPATAAELSEPFEALRERFGRHVGALLYGGSVNPQNAAELLGMENVDGLFIGRSAWTAEGFTELLELASAA
ncbi:triose-phosphate isomerase [Nesterenkonia haasae]|uniref:triose-phosphate isomerase n=1 Tax=Nesterenkonia haasae TaxID=2587813 RepID=UPI001391C7EE|nr:triose-phosphate isomerase [Nesterenkonia haasae]NDK31640.1 triose-phosphate isomerase [Nesterenkonia haasae]